MRMFRWIGRELAGLWRSVRYDLARRTSLSRQRTEVLHPEYDAYRRPPRRWWAAVGLGALVAALVTAVYLAAAGGLGALLSPIVDAVPGGHPAPPAVRPVWSGAPARSTPSGRVSAGAHGAVARHPSSAPAGTPPAPDAEAAQPVLAPVPVPSCQCPAPVPTPASPSATPSNSPSATGSPSVSHPPSPTPTGGTGTQP